MSKGINEKTGTIDVYELCPERGDSVMIVNCGTHFEVRQHFWEQQSLFLTDDDIERLKQGIIIWH